MFETIRKLIRRREFWIACTIFLLVGAVGTYIAIKNGVTPAILNQRFDEFLFFIRDKPLVLYLAIVLLPAFPVPVSPLLVTVGLVYMPVWGPILSFLYGFSAVVLNMSWTWWVSAYPGRRLAARILEKFDVKLEDPEDPKPRLPLMIFLRVTPGFPFFLQNILLGFLRVPFATYILVSAALTSVFNFGFIVLPRAMKDGQLGLVFLAVTVVLLGIFGMRWLRSRLPQPDDLKPAATENSE